MTGADEDELLLSDDGALPFTRSTCTSNAANPLSESLACKISQQREEDRLDGEAVKPSTSEAEKPRASETKESSGHRQPRHPAKAYEPSSNANDVVSSTNKEDEENVIQSSSELGPSGEQVEEINSSEARRDDDNASEVTSAERDNRSETTFEPSQETATSSQLTSEDYDRSEGNDFEADDSDDASERQNRNRKLCVEREQVSQQDEQSRGPPHGQHFQRGRSGPHFQNARHPGPRGHQSYRMPNENFGQPFMQYGPPNRHPGNAMRPPFNRMPMQPMQQMGNSNRFPPQLGGQPMSGPPNMPPHRMQRPMFFPNNGPPQMGNANQFRPFGGNASGALRPPQPIPPFPQFQPQSAHPGNMIIHRAAVPQPAIHNQNVNPAFVGAAGPVALPAAPQLPARKVLLNPNFKGGVQAATSESATGESRPTD